MGVVDPIAELSDGRKCDNLRAGG